VSILNELSGYFNSFGIPCFTDRFPLKAPETYAVLTPMSDGLALYSEGKPEFEIPDVRISLYTRENYKSTVSKITSWLLNNKFYIIDRLYLGYEGETENAKYYHYVIDVQKIYMFTEE